MSIFNKNNFHKPLLVLVLLLLLLKAFYSEKMIVNMGLGWDGATFADMTKNIFQHLKTNFINSYYLQRTFVPLVLHIILSFFNIEFTTPNIIKAYEYFNIFCITVSAIYFFLISKKLKLSRNEEVIGFASLFFCFPIIKFGLFYPVLMDIPAYALAILFLYYYLNQKKIICFIIILIGSFVFPTFILLSLLLIFNSNSKDNLLPGDETKKTKWAIFINGFLRVGFCFALPLLLIYMLIGLYYNFSFDSVHMTSTALILKNLIKWLSFLTALVYLVYMIYYPKEVFDYRKLFSKLNFSALFFSIFIFISTSFIVKYFSSGIPSLLTLETYLLNIIKQVGNNPFNFLAAHVFYYGLIPLMLLLLIKDIKHEILKISYGMLTFFSLVIFFSVGNESRQLINYYPFLVLLVLLVLNKYWNVSGLFSILYCLACLALSHFWYNINAVSKGYTYYKDFPSFFKFPVQRYFMFHGPWVSNTMYMIHIAICLALFLLIFYAIKKTKLITRKTT